MPYERTLILTETLESKISFKHLNQLVNEFLESQRISETSLISIETSVYSPSFAEIDIFYSTVVYKKLFYKK